MISPDRKILTAEELVRVRDELRRAGEAVVQCHGCFDIVHPGHVRYLRFAREQGDRLIVSVSSDGVVGKGVDRPYISEELRLENLAALEFVDYVCLDDNAWAGPILERLKPDVYIKGKEYESNNDPRFLKEKELVESYGGKVLFSSGDVVFSSTSIIEQFKGQFDLEHQKVEAFCRRHDITRPRLADLISRFSGLRVLVIGDPIIDNYVHCDTIGVAAEGPILSVSPAHEENYLGAGALIALQMAALGAAVSFVTPLDRGAVADDFIARLEEVGVAVVPIQIDSRPVFVKTRYLVEGKKLLKVDRGHLTPLSSTATAELIRQVEARLPDHDALAITDFGYGLFGGELVEAINDLARRQVKPHYVDVSHTGRASVLRFARPRLSTPTEQELRFAFADNESGLSNLASRFYARTDAEQLLLTLGRRGVIIFHRSDQPGARLPSDYLPSLTRRVVDTVGAGDVLFSITTLADLAGASLTTAAYLGAFLASIHIERLGNDAVDGATLLRALDDRPELR